MIIPEDPELLNDKQKIWDEIKIQLQLQIQKFKTLILNKFEGLNCQVNEFPRSLLATEWIAKTDFYAAASAASAVSIYYVVIGGRFAPPYKYMIK